MKPERKAVAISEEGKGVLAILKSNSPMVFPALKDQNGFSNKKWDRAERKENS